MSIFDKWRRRPEEDLEATLPVMPDGAPPSAPVEGIGTVGIGAFARPEESLTINEALAKPVIGKDQIREAMHTLRRYKAGKSNFESRIIDNEQWWKLRHWERMREEGTTKLRTKSAWLVNVVLSKHADAMDALPEPNCLPRAADDEQEARTLSKVVPVVLQQNNFDLTWSENWWKKLKAGVAFYGVFWDSNALNGLGDIAVRAVDPLSLFWEPGVKDLQESRNIFSVTLKANEELEADYPELKGELGSKAFQVREYIYDDSVDTSDKSPVIDWYYKKKEGGRQILHYVKFVGEHVLYATENEPELTGRGLYDHGLYPFFADVLFPEEGTPTGYGYIDICKDAQRQIDLMNNAIVANTVACATPRWFKRGDDGVNEEEFADWTKPFVHVQGTIEENALRQIQINPMPGNLITVLDQKIAEMKETSGNRDVNNGATPSGVTAASAIAAMQEQSGKLSRDQIQNSYNCYRQIVYTVIELIRQFYDMPRQFRIVGPENQPTFVQFDNSGLLPQPIPGDNMGILQDGMRLPVFDIEVNAQKQSAYNKLSYNELAIQFFQLGFFNPQLADQALAALEMMDFKGKEQMRARIQQNSMQFMLMQQAMMMAAQGGTTPAGGNDRPVRLVDTNPNGDQQQKNRYVEAARGRAQAATQPR